MSRISSLAPHRKSMKSAAPAASAPGERSSAGMIRSERCRSVAYSCALRALGLYAPFCAAFSCATASWTCCASAAATRLAPAASFASRSRRENWSGLDIAFPHFIGEVFGGAPRKRHNAQGDILVRVADERRGVADEQVLHLVRLAVLIQHRRLR